MPQSGALEGSVPNLQLSGLIPLAMSNNRMSVIQNSFFSGLGLLERPPWSVLSQEAMLMSVVHAISQNELMSLVCAAFPDHVDACDLYGLCCH